MPGEQAGFAVRPAGEGDMDAVAEIFGHYVTTTVVTLDLDPPSPDQWRARLRAVRADGKPFLVAVVGELLVGFGYLSAWRSKPGYRHTVEDTVYISPRYTGHGYGGRLLAELLAQAAALGARQVIAVVANSGNPASLALHRAAGFTEVGRLREVGYKHGRWVDTALLQRALERPSAGRLQDAAGGT
jgi:phosphinothricin acetyltransferase